MLSLSRCVSCKRVFNSKRERIIDEDNWAWHPACAIAELVRVSKRLLNCPDLNLESQEEETVAACTDMKEVLQEFTKNGKRRVE